MRMLEWKQSLVPHRVQNEILLWLGLRPRINSINVSIFETDFFIDYGIRTEDTRNSLVSTLSVVTEVRLKESWESIGEVSSGQMINLQASQIIYVTSSRAANP